MKKLLVILTAFVMLFSTGCGNDDRMVIGSVIFEGTNEWFVEARAGMQDAAKELNVNLTELDSHYDVHVERDLIHEQVKNKSSAIVICPLSVEESGASTSEAMKMGIPVVTWNSVVNPPPTAQIIVDSAVLGSATGDYVVKYVKDHNIQKLKAAFIIDNSFSIGIERCNGFRQSVQPLITSGIMELVVETKGNLYEQTSVTVEKLLQEHPEINFIWCWNQMSTRAAVDVLKHLNRSDIIIAGTDMSISLAADMIDDKVNLIAITTQQPYQMGHQAVVTAVKAVKGESVEKSIIIPTLTFTRENPDLLKEYIDSHQKFSTGPNQ